MYYILYTRNENTETKKLDKLIEFEAKNRNQAYRIIKPLLITSTQGQRIQKENTVLDSIPLSRSNLHKMINGGIKECNGFFLQEYESREQTKNRIFINGNDRFIKDKPAVLDDFVVFDIETTHIGEQVIEIDEDGKPIKKPQAVCYLYGFKEYNFIKGEAVSEYKPFNNVNAIEQVRNYLKELNERARAQNKYIVIYAHNLIVELTELMQNVFTYEDVIYLQEHAYNNLYRGSRSKPIVFQYGHLKFCDSLALLNKGLEKVAKDVGLVKNEQNKTYKEKWYLGSKLPQWEFDYNETDLDITAYGVIKLLKQAGFRSLKDVFEHNVVTSTGLTKYINKNVISKEQRHKKRKYATANLPFDIKNNVKIIDVKRLKKWQDEVFKGGLCYANFRICYKILNGVISLDVASLYPSEMLLRQYPKKLVKFDIAQLKNFKSELEFFNYMQKVNFDKLTKNNAIYDFKKQLSLKLYKHIPYFYIATVTLKNVKYKQFKNDNVLLSMADSKCVSISNPITDGEKIYSCDRIVLSISSIEFLTYQLLYDFEIENAIIDCYTNKWGYLPDGDIITLNYHGQRKYNASKLIKSVENKFNNDDLLNKLDTDKQLFYSLSYDEQLNFAENLKQYIKQTGLNNQYGINAQKIINDTFYFDYDKQEYLQQEELQGINSYNTTERNYIVGICITAYSRLDLVLMFLNIVEKTQAIFVYCDTDSLKFHYKNKADKQAIYKIANEYNKYKQEYRNQLELYFNSHIDYDDTISLFNFGDWEQDGEYILFKTLGTKAYCYYYQDGEGKYKIKKTIAGIKKPFEIFLNDKIKSGMLPEKVLNNYIKPNTLLSANVSGNTQPRQPHKEFIKMELMDDNGENQQINQYCSYVITNHSKWIQEKRLADNNTHFNIFQFI